MLTAAVDRYVALRRSLGFRFRDEGTVLRSYADFATGRGDKHVCTNHVLEWAALARTPGQREKRLRLVVAFARHARAEDIRHELPPRDVFARRDGRQRPPPYIYTRDEIRVLLDGATRLLPAGSLRAHTYHTLFGLLACTGLRVSEALALQFEDFSEEILIVRRTKFGKTRLVPLHTTAVAALRDYLRRRQCVRPLDDHLFVSSRGNPLRYRRVYRTFRQLVAGWPVPSSRRRPTIHALRHTFAVRALELSPTGRDHVGWHIRALSTYLGHSTVACTYWYLRATPHLMQDLANLCQPIVEGTSP